MLFIVFRNLKFPEIKNEFPYQFSKFHNPVFPTLCVRVDETDFSKDEADLEAFVLNSPCCSHGCTLILLEEGSSCEPDRKTATCLVGGERQNFDQNLN